MFDLNSQQEDMAEQSTEEIKAWLGRESFPGLVVKLEHAKSLWEAERFKEATAYFDDATQAFIKDFLSTASPHLVALLLTLDEDNAQTYIAYNQDQSEEWFAYAESHTSKVESRIERLETWFGDLSEQQLTRVETIVTLLPREQNIRVQNNQYWVEKVLAASLSRDRSALEHWLNDTSRWWLEDYKNLRVANKAQTLALIDMMISTMSEKQQAHVLDVVDEWIDNLEALSTPTQAPPL